MNKKVEVGKIKSKLGEALGKGKCFICEKNKSKTGFTIHHLRYIFQDIFYKNYKHLGPTDGQYSYYKDLEPVVLADLERFMYLCNTDHVALERLNRYNPEKLIKLIEALLLTQTNDKHKGKLIVLLKELVSRY